MGGEWEGNDSLFCLLFCFTRPFFFFLSSIYVKRIWNRVDKIDRRILMVKMRQWTHYSRVFFHADYENLVYFASSHQDFFLLMENLSPLFNKPLNGLSHPFHCRKRAWNLILYHIFEKSWHIWRKKVTLLIFYSFAGYDFIMLLIYTLIFHVIPSLSTWISSSCNIEKQIHREVFSQENT